MKRVPLSEIGAGGKDIIIDDQNIWLEPMKEFGISCKILTPLTAKVFLSMQDEGCLVRGTITGSVLVPCNRCNADTQIELNYSFDEFEEIIFSQTEEKEDNLLDVQVVIWQDGKLYLDLAALLWEEFSLAVPVKPLCKKDCKGLCPKCGKNLNEGDCGCPSFEGDPRLAALRQFKVRQ